MARKRVTSAALKNSGLTKPQIAFVVEYCKDLDARRAAAATGHEPDEGFEIRKDPLVAEWIWALLDIRVEKRDEINAEWLLWELVDNHQLARAGNQLNASNNALGLLAKHAMVDAFAAEKMEVADASTVRDRLLRARSRRNKKDTDEEVTFL